MPSKKIDAVIIALFILVLILSNIIWLKIDTRPPHWDFAIHLSNILTYLNFLDNKQLFKLITHYSYYPPLSYYLTIFTYKFFGINEDIAVLSLTPYLIILIFSTYKIGQSLKNHKLGILMVISMIGMPFLMSQTREYQLDFPLTAMTALNLYLFLKTNLFKNRKFSIIFGCASGLAMLTKWTYLIFFVGMMIVSFIFDRKNCLIKLKLKNVVLILITMLVIGGSWYINNLSKLKVSFNENIIIAIREHDPQILSKESLLWYVNSLYRDHLRFPFLILSAIGLTHLIKNRKKLKKTVQLFIISFFYLLIMTIYRNKDARFMEPLAPVCTILVSFWIIGLKNSLIRNLLIVFLVFVSLFNYYSSSFGIMGFPYVLESKLFNLDIIWYKQYGYTTGPPKRENWYLKEVINEIVNSPKGSLIVLNEDKMFLNRFNIEYYRRLYTKNLNIDTEIGNDKCKDQIHTYSYLVINDNPEGKLILTCKVILENYYKKKEFSLPDNSIVSIFERR